MNNRFSSSGEKEKKSEPEINKKSKDINLESYKDLDGHSIKRLNIGFWFLKNSRYFFISLIVLLILLSVIFYSKFFYNIYIYIKETPVAKKTLEELSSGPTINPGSHRQAKSLEADRSQVFFNGQNYDFITKIKNPNDNFIVKINYCFMEREEKLSCSESRVFPLEEKYLIALSVKADHSPTDLSLALDSTNWERLDSRKYPNWDNYYLERNNFTIWDLEFSVSEAGSFSARGNNNLSFKIKNNTAYNYWELPLKIVLFNVNNIVGVNEYKVLEIKSLEEKKINLSWPNAISGVNRVEVFTDLDILDFNNYISY